MSRSEELQQQLIEALEEDAGSLRAEIEQLDVELDQIKAQRTGKVTALNDVVSRLRVLGVRQQSAPALAQAQEYENQCRHCTRSFPTKQGLTMHNTRSHPDMRLTRSAPAVPAPSDPEPTLGEHVPKLVDMRPAHVGPSFDTNPDAIPDPPSSEAADDERAIRCEQCEWTGPNPRQLLNHVTTHHGRRALMKEERMPRRAMDDVRRIG